MIPNASDTSSGGIAASAWNVSEALLSSLARRASIPFPVALVVAHPDDETIGIGPLLHLFRDLRMVHVTDGAPRDLRDANPAGFGTSADYAAARAEELRVAIELGGAAPSIIAMEGLPIPDQSAAYCLSRLAAILRRTLAGTSAVLTHAFEGGHPDHDAVAFAVHASGLPVIEMTGYHATPDDRFEAGCFRSGPGGCVIALTPEEQARREAMLACFVTQQSTLAPFFGAREMRFRAAPTYDFAAPPWSSAWYDRFGWGMTSATWRRLAAEASRC